TSAAIISGVPAAAAQSAKERTKTPEEGAEDAGQEVKTNDSTATTEVSATMFHSSTEPVNKPTSYALQHKTSSAADLLNMLTTAANKDNKVFDSPGNVDPIASSLLTPTTANNHYTFSGIDGSSNKDQLDFNTYITSKVGNLSGGSAGSTTCSSFVSRSSSRTGNGATYTTGFHLPPNGLSAGDHRGTTTPGIMMNNNGGTTTAYQDHHVNADSYCSSAAKANMLSDLKLS
ncbi:unnamed protein product, partial [Amoebophrya sp. A120]